MEKDKLGISQYQHINSKGSIESAAAGANLKKNRKDTVEHTTERVASYLTIGEKEAWINKLDGRAESKVIRKLIQEWLSS